LNSNIPEKDTDILDSDTNQTDLNDSVNEKSIYDSDTSRTFFNDIIKDWSDIETQNKSYVLKVSYGLIFDKW
jgi:hypothetical protein